MKRFKTIDKRLRKIIIIVLFIIILFIYFDLINNTTFYKYILDNINSKYDYEIKLNDKIIYNTLNKIVILNDKNNIETKEVIKIEKIDSNKNENKIEKELKPIVYIYNTHENESYYLPFISDYSITPNVKFASYILKDYLSDEGILSFVQNKSIKKYLNKYKLDYTGSYQASRVYMKEEFKKNKYKILIDLHRDSAKHKYTLYKKDGKKYAKIMFVLATNYKTYKENEKFVNNLNNRIQKKYKGLSRGILKRSDAIFNQDLSPRAILIELGGVDNTLEEINNTLQVLSKILSEYIKEEL